MDVNSKATESNIAIKSNFKLLKQINFILNSCFHTPPYTAKKTQKTEGGKENSTKFWQQIKVRQLQSDK